MSPDDFEAQQARICALFGRWRAVLTLDEWFIDLLYRDDEYIRGDGSRSDKALASTDVQWEYRRAQITFRCDLCATEDDDELEYCLVHECMHVLLNGQRPVASDNDGPAGEYRRLFEEHTATTLARAFIRARKMEATDVETGG